MNFNHIILKEEIDTILAENKKGLKTYKVAHYAYLLIGILTTYEINEVKNKPVI